MFQNLLRYQSLFVIQKRGAIDPCSVIVLEHPQI